MAAVFWEDFIHPGIANLSAHEALPWRCCFVPPALAREIRQVRLKWGEKSKGEWNGTVDLDKYALS